MKRILILFMAFSLGSNIWTMRNWKFYTNTTHIYDMVEIDDKFYIGTWGGLEIYDPVTKEFIRAYTTVDGLHDIDIKSIVKSEKTGTILLGTIKSGINRLRDGNFLLPLNDVLGLPDNNINAIIHSDSLIYVATNQGLTVLREDDDFPYPLPIYHVATHNGLSSNRVSSIVLTDNGYFLCGTDNGLNYVHKSNITDLTAWQHFYTGNSPLPDNIINSISNSDSVFAIATRNGLIRINDINDQNEWTIFDTNTHPDDIVSGEILTAYIDSDHNIWFTYGIWDENILYIENPPFDPDFPLLNPELYPIIKISPDDEFTICQINQAGMSTSAIKGFKEIRNRLYAFTWGYGFFYLENDTWHQQESNCLVAGNVTDMAVDNNNKLWVTNGYIGGNINRKGTRGVSGFDGYHWTNFRAETSPLTLNRKFRVGIDMRNRKWFGGWGGGISIYDENDAEWHYLTRSNGLEVNEIGDIISDKAGNVWVSNYSGGMYIYDIDAIETSGTIAPLTSFQLYSPDIHVSDVIKIHHTSDKTFFGSRYSGIRYWDDSSFPQNHQPGDAWRMPPFSQLSNTYIYDIDSRETFFGEEVWIAAESGLFMYDTNLNRWYRYTTTIKREVWVGTWQRDILYFEDEVRLFGAAPTFPTALLVDPFNRVWIGTDANGLTLYDLNINRFTVYNQDNAPLLSNKITALAYEPYSGNLFIGTDEGLVSVEIGRIYKDTDIKLSSTIAYPNPFRPDMGETLIIANQNNDIMPEGKNQCRIYDMNGDLIIILEEDRFFKFSWDGRNSAGKRCSSGIYFYVVSSSSGDTSRGTIALIR
ncbi:MAG: hypothetical protein K0B81_07130 [Candidatus Cloacimonetes bacterium]|nr:hypothetical protein [Candidatus Cloacimonadota bacterium]